MPQGTGDIALVAHNRLRQETQAGGLLDCMQNHIV
jgi:hypothetical protein